MFCIKCGEPLKEGAAFCHACGERVDGQKTETTRSEGHKQKNPTKKVIAVAVLLAVAIVGIKIAGSIGNSSGGPASTPRGNQQSVQCSPCDVTPAVEEADGELDTEWRRTHKVWGLLRYRLSSR